MTLDQRILNRAEGYWTHAPLGSKAQLAWAHLLERHDPDAVLAALDDFAAEGHRFPPGAGQLAARIQPPAKPDGHETEQQRCVRQRDYARRCVKEGRMSKRDFDWYEETYWSHHAPPTQVKGRG